MEVWTVANQKGGVGKTSTTVALAGIAAAEGKRVLMVDLDPHGSLSMYFRQEPDYTHRSSYTLFEKRESLTAELVHSLVRKTPMPTLHLLPAATPLATLERQMHACEGLGLVMKKAVQAVADDYDIILLDCPPVLGVLMINALAAADQLIIPVQTEHLAIKGLERMLHTLKMLSRSRPKPLSFVVVPTMFDRRTQAGVQSLRVLRNEHGDHVWQGKIVIDTKIRDASKAGVPPNLFAPKSSAVACYQQLYRQLSAHKVATGGDALPQTPAHIVASSPAEHSIRQASL